MIVDGAGLAGIAGALGVMAVWGADSFVIGLRLSSAGADEPAEPVGAREVADRVGAATTMKKMSKGIR